MSRLGEAAADVGVGVGLTVGFGVGFGVGAAVGLGVGVGFTVGLRVGVGVAVGLGVGGFAVGLGVGVVTEVAEGVGVGVGRVDSVGDGDVEGVPVAALDGDTVSDAAGPPKQALTSALATTIARSHPCRCRRGGVPITTTVGRNPRGDYGGRTRSAVPKRPKSTAIWRNGRRGPSRSGRFGDRWLWHPERCG
jgi:hypothetical protein